MNHVRTAPSVSQAQQRIMGMAWAYQQGDLALDDIPSGLRKTIKNIADSMKSKDLSDFAHTKRKGLPERVTNIIDMVLKEAAIPSLRQFNKMIGRWRPENYTGEEKFDDIGLVVWKTETPDQNGKLYAIAYAGRANKPLWHYTFRTEQAVRHQIDETADGLRKSKQRVEERRKERSEYKHDYQVGDILYSSWGFDQTNVSWYQVVDIRDKSVLLREISEKVVGDHQYEFSVMPNKDSFKSEARLYRVGPSGSVKINSYSWAHKWDGKPQRETNPVYGH